MTAAESDLFNRICWRVNDGSGLTLRQLGGAHALARELAGDPEPDRVADLADRLGLDEAQLEEIGRGG